MKYILFLLVAALAVWMNYQLHVVFNQLQGAAPLESLPDNLTSRLEYLENEVYTLKERIK